MQHIWSRSLKSKAFSWIGAKTRKKPVFLLSMWCLMGIILGNNNANTFFSVKSRTRMWIKMKLTWFSFFLFSLFNSVVISLILLVAARSGSAWLAGIMGRSKNKSKSIKCLIPVVWLEGYKDKLFFACWGHLKKIHILTANMVLDVCGKWTSNSTIPVQ